MDTDRLQIAFATAAPRTHEPAGVASKATLSVYGALH
jgi:hypothetical protein